MRLSALTLKNFRCFPDEAVKFSQYCALVGANNAGKSAILAAIDIFFRSNPKSIPITIDDFYRRDAERELQIILTFTDLSEEATKEFSHYVRSGELTFFIKAQLEGAQVRASLHGMRLGNPEFIPFYELSSAAEKKAFYEPFVGKYKLPKWQNQTQAAEALQAFESASTENKTLIPSDDKAFGVEGPIPRLRQFIDFVFIPAVKNAGEEEIEARNTAFSRLVDRAVRAKLNIEERIEKIRTDARAEIESIADDHKQILSGLASAIQTQYQRISSSDSKIHLEWGQFDDKNLQFNLPPVRLQISDDLIKNSISKFGHGTQRNYLMALLLLSSSYDFTKLQTLIVACEEPELYQHPPQAKVLAAAMHSLASNQTQVIITTHSPYFVTSKSFEDIRVVRRSHGVRSKAYGWSVDENSALIAKAKGEEPIGAKAALAAINQFLQPQMNEMFFSQGVIFVEGDEDRAILAKHIQMTNKHTRLLERGVHILPTSGKGNLINAIAIARGFEIPFYAVFDGDMNLEGDDKTQSVQLNKNILSLLGYEGPGKDGTIESHIARENFCVWKDCIQTAFEAAELEKWEEEKRKIAQEFGWSIKRLKKNAMVVEAALERLYKGKAVPHLDTLTAAIEARFLS